MTPFLEELIAAGDEFESQVVAGAEPVTIPLGNEKEFFQGNDTVFTTRLFRNESLHLKGRPDGVVSAGGAVEPIEIKSHRRVRPSDRVELAFYWQLLEPLRTVDAAPIGWVFLRSPDGSVSRERVAIPRTAFIELDKAINGVRKARVNGVPQTRFCRCAVCGGIKRDEVRERTINAQDVSAISGVGRKYAELLQACGVDDWTALLAYDPDLLADRMRSMQPTGPLFSPDQVRRWQAHARALQKGEPEWVGTPMEFPVPASYIALDLEYVAETKNVWLIGARVVNPGVGDVAFSCWFDPEGSSRALTAIAELLDAHPGLPVVTYNGLSADLPMLRAVGQRCGAEMHVSKLEERHFDLYRWLADSLMLPVLEFRLKNVMDWAGIARAGDVGGGLHATVLYRRYLRNADPATRDLLLDYNRDDVDGLVQVIEQVRGIVNGLPSQKYTPNEVTRVIDRIFEAPFAPSKARQKRSPVRERRTAPNAETLRAILRDRRLSAKKSSHVEEVDGSPGRDMVNLGDSPEESDPPS